MKCRPIFLALVLLAGCSEIHVRDRDNTDELPHIVKINPPLHTFTREEAAALVNPPGQPPFGLPESLPRTFLVLKRNSHNTVKITFSRTA